MQSFNDLAILSNGPLSFLVREPPLSGRFSVIRVHRRESFLRGYPPLIWSI